MRQGASRMVLAMPPLPAANRSSSGRRTCFISEPYHHRIIHCGSGSVRLLEQSCAWGGGEFELDRLGPKHFKSL